jgi:hypothetical protein
MKGATIRIFLLFDFDHSDGAGTSFALLRYTRGYVQKALCKLNQGLPNLALARHIYSSSKGPFHTLFLRPRSHIPHFEAFSRLISLPCVPIKATEY